MAHILVVDDDAHIRELVEVILSKEGFSIIQAVDGEAAISKLQNGKVDLIILDIMMPNMDGWSFCREVRTYYPENLPILMLTAKGETTQKVKGFTLGADDYVVKPFAPQELVVRVKALLRRYQISISNQVHIGNIILDRDTLKVSYQEEETILPLKEFELLFKLASYPKRIFSREQLIEDIWGLNYEGEERTVDVHINRLRQRFSSEEFPFKIITVRGLGYRLEVTL